MTTARDTSDQAAGPPLDRYVIRGVDAAADAGRLLRLLNEIQRLDGTRQHVTAAELQSRLSRPDHDPARDRWLVEDRHGPAPFIGHGQLATSPGDPGGWLRLEVHPAQRRRGLGSALLRAATARARELGTVYLDVSVRREQADGHAFAHHYGFRQVQTFVAMRLPAETTPPALILPDGYTLRPYSEVNDLAVFVEVMNRGFIGHWNYHEENAAQLAHWLAADGVHAAGILLAFAPNGAVAGVCACQLSAGRSAALGVPVGYIDSLGVAPEHRRRGLGRALLLAGIGWLRNQGRPVVELDAVGDNRLALPLYADVGFGVTQEAVGYRRDL